MLDEIVCHKLQLLARAADLSAWRKLVHDRRTPSTRSTSPSCGKYVDLQDSYKSLTRR